MSWSVGRQVSGAGGRILYFNNRLPLAIVIAAALWTVSAPNAQQKPVATPPAIPQRIISLVPAVTEMLFAIGAGDRVAAVSNFDKYPPEVERLPRVGALLDPDLERILSLRPDLVVVYHSQKELMAQLSRGGVPFFSYAHADLADVTKTIRQVGERVGSASQAAAVAAKIEASIDAVRARVKGKPRPRTLAVFGREPYALRGIYASGGFGFVHDMITAAGGDNVFADLRRQSVQATTELIIARRPDVILELRASPIAPDVEQKELRTWAALSSVPAIRTGRVHIIADERTVVPGPRVAEGVQVLERFLQRVK